MSRDGPVAAELLELPRADPERAADVRAALEWVAALVNRAGGEARLVGGSTGELVVGDLRASAGAFPCQAACPSAMP